MSLLFPCTVFGLFYVFLSDNQFFLKKEMILIRRVGYQHLQIFAKSVLVLVFVYFCSPSLQVKQRSTKRDGKILVFDQFFQTIFKNMCQLVDYGRKTAVSVKHLLSHHNYYKKRLFSTTINDGQHNLSNNSFNFHQYFKYGNEDIRQKRCVFWRFERDEKSLFTLYWVFFQLRVTFLEVS